MNSNSYAAYISDNTVRQTISPHNGLQRRNVMIAQTGFINCSWIQLQRSNTINTEWLAKTVNTQFSERMDHSRTAIKILARRKHANTNTSQTDANTAWTQTREHLEAKQVNTKGLRKHSVNAAFTERKHKQAAT